jgi:three-Cys-motif partner protein
VLATRTAKNSGVPYTDIYLVDFETAFVDAACKRLPSNVGRVHPAIGPAENTVNQIVKNLNPAGLHFAFLDPYKLDPLPFSVIETLAKLKRMDILIHVSVQDFQRNLRRYMEEKSGPLDRFAPGWRSVVNDQEPDRTIRMAIFRHWVSLIRALDMAPSEGIERVVGSKRQPLYWLVLVSRHNRAHEFWEKIRNVSPQGRLKL